MSQTLEDPTTYTRVTTRGFPRTFEAREIGYGTEFVEIVDRQGLSITKYYLSICTHFTKGLKILCKIVYEFGLLPQHPWRLKKGTVFMIFESER